MLRLLLFIHRYLAVAVGLLMALWCLSGFVMMYQPFPALTQTERLAGLAPLRLEGCCQTQILQDARGSVGDLRIEMLGEHLVLRQPGAPPVDLVGGEPVNELARDPLMQIAADHAARRGLRGTPRWLGIVQLDQWTIQSARDNAPVHHFALDDAAGTELYVNGRSGEVFLDTNRRERVLSWLGAIPHWLYPTVLRRNGALWSQVVIWTSVLGTFLAATGLYVGITRFRRNREGRLASPFRGWWYWHHITGLFFGVLALTWVFSGLLTMNPWGWLEGGDVAARVRPQLTGIPTAEQLRSFLRAAPEALAGEDIRQIRGVPFGGSLRLLAERGDGSRLLLDAGAQPAPLDDTQVRAAFAGLDLPVRSLEKLATEDAYYYAHKGVAALPVWRAVLDDAAQSRIYVNPEDGAIRVVDGAAKKARWITQGLHSLDFPVLRWRPAWDVVTLLLLGGVTVLCVTGSWMAAQRVAKDARAAGR